MPLLEVSDLVSGYDGVEILHGVSIHVEAGELITIIGPNGSGKSTLLKTVFGLLKPTRGTVRFQDTAITGEPPEKLVRRGISYVPQSSNVFPSLTVQENLEMGAFVARERPVERVQQMYAMFPDLAEKRGQRAGSLSGGQRQMLAFARALMLEPRLLLLDEPSAGLSPAMLDRVLERVARIHQSGISVVIVEQNAREALKLSSRGYVLANGENRLEAGARELLEDPEVTRLYLGG